jgi:hypothetical protein
MPAQSSLAKEAGKLTHGLNGDILVWNHVTSDGTS